MNENEEDDDMRDFIVNSDSLHSSDFNHSKQTSHSKRQTKSLSPRIDDVSKHSTPMYSIQKNPSINVQSRFQPSSSLMEEDKRRILGSSTKLHFFSISISSRMTLFFRNLFYT